MKIFFGDTRIGTNIYRYFVFCYRIRSETKFRCWGV